MHRARMAMPWLRSFGWEPTVLCVKPEFVPAPQDELLLKTIPAESRIVAVDAISLKQSRRFGFGSLTLRSYSQLKKAGECLLKEHFDLVYLTTTEFSLFRLGNVWLRQFGCPYVLDYQDPWITDYYRKNHIRPPGGPLRHRITQMLARWQEPTIVRNAASITVVSETYAEQLIERYQYPRDRIHVIPFGGATSDINVAKATPIPHGVFDKGDGHLHWVYAGVAGPYMNKSLTALFRAFRTALDRAPDQFGNIRLHFVGTDYAPAGQAKPQVMPIAEKEGVAKWVRETPQRIPYFAVLRCLLEADALIVPGSNDAGYTASKIFPYILAARPLLTVFHTNSSVNQIVSSCQAGECVQFDDDSTIDRIGEEILARWFLSGKYDQSPPTNWRSFARYDSSTMTEQLSSVFSMAALK